MFFAGFFKYRCDLNTFDAAGDKVLDYVEVVSTLGNNQEFRCPFLGITTGVRRSDNICSSRLSKSGELVESSTFTRGGFRRLLFSESVAPLMSKSYSGFRFCYKLIN